MRVRETFNSKLLVEGNDDQHITWAICKESNLEENFDVIDCGGIDNLFAQIPIRFKQRNISSIGIIIDADVNLKERWISIKALLNKHGFYLPHDLPTTGIVVEITNIKLGIIQMPNNNQNGMVEDFIGFLIPKTDVLLPIVDATLEEIENRGINLYSPIHKSKARIHAWLSLQETPGTPMGLAITKKFLSTESHQYNNFISWLKRLFTT